MNLRARAIGAKEDGAGLAEWPLRAEQTAQRGRARDRPELGADLERRHKFAQCFRVRR